MDALSVLCAQLMRDLLAIANRVLTTLENMENMEISGNLLILENSGKTQGI